ncbi:c-type cytochrome [Chelatococcus sp. GCM10030263]|uniref:c-type cytochrome n=1 Tax=Chelatococcus sp. GCM10030263 TaxID=3273387 RepID=UPI00360E0609
MRTSIVTFGLAIGAGLVIGLPALSQMAATESPEARGDRRVEILQGRSVALNGGRDQGAIACARCHELDGAGNASGAFPRLTDQSGWYLYKTLQDYAAGLRPNAVMAPIAKALTEDEMLAVSSYYASLEDAPYPAPPRTDVELMQIGGAISARGIPEQGVPACGGCHGEDGVGKPPFYPYVAGQFAPYLEYQLLQWKKGVRKGDPQSVMELIAKAMTEDQIRAVSLFLANVRGREITPDEPRFRPPEAVRRPDRGQDTGAAAGDAPARRP